MSLMTTAEFLQYTDYIAAVYNRLAPIMDTVVNQASPIVGTVQNWAAEIQEVVVGSNNWELETDCNSDVNLGLNAANIENVTACCSLMRPTRLDLHFSRGSEVNSSIVDTTSYLTYYDTSPGGGPSSTWSIRASRPLTPSRPELAEQAVRPCRR